MSRFSKQSNASSVIETGAFTRSFLWERGPSLDWANYSSLSTAVGYECSSELVVLNVSSNAVELLGIEPEGIVGNSALWNERLVSDDRRRLARRLKEMSPTSVVTEVHRLIDDRGLPVWVAHSFRKVGVAADSKIFGSLMPLPRELRDRGLHPDPVAQFVHKIGNHFQLVNLLIGSLKRNVKAVDEIDSLQQTVDRAAELTRQFLHYSQSQNVMSDVDLGEILGSVSNLYVPHFAEKGVTFQNLLEGSLDGVLVRGDPFSLELAFDAILRNALDATDSGDRVILSEKPQTSRSRTDSVVRISVADTGTGIDPQLLEKIGAPFYTTKPEHEGLGLSLAMKVIDWHGGLLDLSSAPGRGTEVKIALPVCGAGLRSDP